MVCGGGWKSANFAFGCISYLMGKTSMAVAKFHKKTESTTKRFQLAVDLRTMFVDQGRDRLEFDHGYIEANAPGTHSFSSCCLLRIPDALPFFFFWNMGFIQFPP